MEPTNYYNETKYCPDCNDYVRFLMSMNASYCVACGSKVHLFSNQDHKAFLTALKGQQKGPRKTGAKKAANKRVS